MGAWFLQRSTQHWIILNPKHTRIYRELPGAAVHRKFDSRALIRDLAIYKFVVLELEADEAEPNYMDGIVAWVHTAMRNVGLCVDELYTMHSRGQSGPGLLGWLTRGREYRQSFLGLTQRPKWISLFCFSESDYLCEMDLTLPEDRERFFEFTGNRNFLARVVDHRWLWYDVARDTITLYGPIPQTALGEVSHG